MAASHLGTTPPGTSTVNEHMHPTSNISRTGDGQLLRRDVMDGCWSRDGCRMQYGCLDAPDYIAAGAWASSGELDQQSILVMLRGSEPV